MTSTMIRTIVDWRAGYGYAHYWTMPTPPVSYAAGWWHLANVDRWREIDMSMAQRVATARLAWE